MKKIFLFLLVVLPCLHGYSQLPGKHIQVQAEDLRIRQVENFTVVDFPDSRFMQDTGNPALPMLVYSFVVPYNAEVKGLNIQVLSKEMIPGEYNIYPAQKPEPNGLNEEEGVFFLNEETYSVTTEYPGKQAEILLNEIQSGFRIVTVGIYPVSYIPGKREVYLSNISFEINYTLSPVPFSSGKKARQSELRAKSARHAIKARVENPGDVENFAPHVEIVSQQKDIRQTDTTNLITPASAYLREELVPDYIIITSEELVESFRPLAGWKTQKGVPAIITTVEEIYKMYPGIDRPEQIRNYLIECYNKWEAELYVLVGGNMDIVPARIIDGFPTDLYYQTTGNTWYNKSSGYFTFSTSGRNLLVGRAPVRNKEDTDNFVRKVLLYEKAGFTDKTYVNNFLSSLAFMEKSNCPNTSSGSQIRYNSSGALSYEFLYRLDEWSKLLIPKTINFKLLIDNHNGFGDVYSYHRNNGIYCQYGNTSIYNATPDDYIPGNLELNYTNLRNELNNGKQHFIYHCDHSSVKSLGISSKDKGHIMTANEVSKLTNGDNLHIMYTITCKTSTFDVPDNFSAEYINARKGGAVAVLGYSDNAYRDEYVEYERFLNSLFHTNGRSDIGYIFHNLPRSTNTTGMRRLQLFGDPEMQVWTSTPKEMNASVSTTALPGNMVRLNVTINETPPATGFNLCISKGVDYYYTTVIEEAGSYGFDLIPLTSDNFVVTITGQNYIPYVFKEFRLYEPYPLIKEVEIIDHDGFHDTFQTRGNGNGKIDAGEIVAFRINFDNLNFPGEYIKEAYIETKNTFGSEYIRIHKDKILYSIDDYERQIFVVEFDWRILAEREVSQVLKNDLNPFTFNVRYVTSSGKTHDDYFNVDIFSPSLQLGRKTLSGSTINPSMTIHLQNTGLGEACGLEATLTCLEEGSYYQPVSVTSPYGDIQYGEEKENIYLFSFRSTDPSKDYPKKYRLEVKDRYGKIDYFNFDLNNIPNQQVQNLRFESNPNSIVLKWNASTGSDIKGYNIYKSHINISRYFIKVNTFTNPHNYFEDYDLSPTSTYYYKIAAVNQDGSEGPHSDILQAYTSFPNKGLFPVRMDLSIDYPANSGIAFYDISGDGNKEIFTTASKGSDSYILGFRADGTELMNLDNNTTTYTGFANLEAQVTGAVSVGRLGNQAYPQVFIVKRYAGWKPGQVTGYYNYDWNGDGHPDTGFTSKETTESGMFLYGPVIASLTYPLLRMDNIITVTCGSDKEERIDVYSRDGIIEWTAKVPNIEGLANQSNIAIGNLGNGYYPDVIIGTNSGVYGYNYQGNSIGISGMLVRPGTISPVFSKAGYAFPFSSPIIADLDGDGVNEIIIRGTQYPYSTADGTRNTTTIFVFDRNGKLKPGWGTNQTKILGVGANGLAVADIYGNGNMYVIEQGYEVINIYDKNGKRVQSHSIPGLKGRQVPIVADMDGDDEAEIIVFAKDQVVSYKMDGTITPGFPLPLPIESGSDYHLGVCDLDGTGKSDLVAAVGTTIYVWETPGRADRIEWGMERGDAQLTGVYTSPKMRAMMEAFSFDDFETEPDKLTGVLKEDCKLYQNTPNPFSSLTEISYYVPCESCKISIDIYHVQGNKVKSYTSLPGGSASIQLSAGELSSGFYIYSLMVNGELVDTRYMAVN